MNISNNCSIPGNICGLQLHGEIKTLWTHGNFVIFTAVLLCDSLFLLLRLTVAVSSVGFLRSHTLHV